MIELSELNKKLFKDIKCCKCGCHSGVYTMKDENGYWYVCNDCDLPVEGSYYPFDAPNYQSYGNCDD